jgi:hypothetical protein
MLPDVTFPVTFPDNICTQMLPLFPVVVKVYRIPVPVPVPYRYTGVPVPVLYHIPGLVHVPVTGTKIPRY